MKISLLQRSNLMQRMTFAFIILYVLMLGILMFGFSIQLNKNSEQTIADSMGQITRYNAQIIQSKIKQVEAVSETISSSYFGLYEKLQMYNGTPDSCIKVFEDAKTQLQNFSNTTLSPLFSKYKTVLIADDSLLIYPELSDFTFSENLFNQNINAWIYGGDQVCNADWYLMANETNGSCIWFTLDSNPDTLFMACHIDFYLVTGNVLVQHVTLGTLLIGIDLPSIWSFMDYSGFSQQPLYMLVDSSGMILSANDAHYNNRCMFEDALEIPWTADGILQKEISIDGTVYRTESALINSSIRLVTFVPEVNLQEPLIRFRWILSCLMILSVIICGVVIHNISLVLSAPILHLSEHMRTKFMQPIIISHKDARYDTDISLLYDSYNYLIAQIKKSMSEKILALENEKNVEIQLLQVQINPHFLCNTLSSVCSLAILHGEPEIASATSELTSLLQYNLGSFNLETTLQKELEMIKNYIKIQNFLHNNVIFVDFNIQTDTAQMIVLKMLLQPLLENCIIHGMNNGTVEIVVSSVTEKNHLKILVEDNGLNGNVEKINSSLDHPASVTPERHHGYGIQNVHQRIRMKYGNDYGLHYSLSETGGLIACVELPTSAATDSADEPIRL